MNGAAIDAIVTASTPIPTDPDIRTRLTAHGTSPDGDRVAIQWWDWSHMAPEVGTVITVTIGTKHTAESTTCGQTR